MQEGFLKRMALARATRVAADFVSYYLSAVDPQELRDKISSGWSIVDTVRQRPKEEMIEVLDVILENYPDVKSIVKRQRKQGAGAVKSGSLELLKEINAELLTDCIVKKLPSHGVVLIENQSWVKDEIRRVGEIIV